MAKPNKCSICGKPATKGNESESPFAAEIYDDHSIAYWWCSRQLCKDEIERRLQDSRDDI